MASFPETFKFGVATSSYQVEGAWNEEGRCESIWDYQTHNFPGRIADKSNGDIACDSYHKLDEDVKNLKQLAVHFYRFSLSWCRILPTGFPNQINQPGIDHYNRLIDKLLEAGIEPVVTLYHWELPQSLENLGSWCNPIMADYFLSYARICFEHFGDRIKTWITINEPCQVSEFAYGDTVLAPFYNSKGIGSYLSGHTVLLAHAKAYHLYKSEFKGLQGGRIGITIESPWFEPATNASEDLLASERSLQMYLGWFAHPIFSQNGDYPAILRERVDRLSREQGFDYSRLPTFTPEEVEMLKGSSDFFGLNHYTSFLVNWRSEGATPSNLNDRGVTQWHDGEWEATNIDAFKVVPWGLRKLLGWIKRQYNNPEVLITENGYAGPANDFIEDAPRINYIKVYLSEILQAILNDGCNVSAYTYWSFMDNFEWSSGYTVRFGLYHVDFNDKERKRTPKSSAAYYRKVIQTRQL